MLSPSKSLGRLGPFPVAFDILQRRLVVNYTLKLSLMKDMWMPSDQFLCNAGDHTVKIELSVLSTKLGVKHNLKQKVAKLFLNMLNVSLLERVNQLKALL